MCYDVTPQSIIRESLNRIEAKIDHLIKDKKIPIAKELEREYIGVYELALLLKVCQKTVYNWVAKDRIPYTKINRRLLFDRNIVEDFARERSYYKGLLETCMMKRSCRKN